MLHTKVTRGQQHRQHRQHLHRHQHHDMKAIHNDRESAPQSRVAPPTLPKTPSTPCIYQTTLRFSTTRHTYHNVDNDDIPTSRQTRPKKNTFNYARNNRSQKQYSNTLPHPTTINTPTITSTIISPPIPPTINNISHVTNPSTSRTKTSLVDQNSPQHWRHKSTYDHHKKTPHIPLPPELTDPTILISPTTTTVEIMTWFQKVSAARHADLLNTAFDLIIKHNVQITPQIYAYTLECNLAQHKFTKSAEILHHAVLNGISLSMPTILHTARELSNAGQVDELYHLCEVITVDPPSLLSSSSDTLHHHHTKFDTQIVREVREALVFSYLTQNRTQDAVATLVSHFGPGTGVLPSNYLICAIAEQLLKFKKPRHAFQFVQNYDVYCFGLAKRKLYSKIAAQFLDLKMIGHLDECLGYMQRNGIVPHQTVLGPLLRHVLKHNDPLVTLQWYKQMFNANNSNRVENNNLIDGDILHTTTSSSPQSELLATLNPSSVEQLAKILNNTETQININDGFNLSAASAILRALFRHGYHNQALDFLQSLPPHISIITTVIQEFYKLKDWDSIRLTFKYMLLRGLPLNTYLLRVLIDSMAFHTNPQHALQLLLYNVLLKQKVEMDIVTFSHVIRAFNTAGLPKHAEQVLDVMVAQGLVPDTTIFTMIMQSYLKVGSVADAFRIKDSMTAHHGLAPSLLSYGVLIDGLLHGNGTYTTQNGNNSLQLYHLFTEIFENADILLSSQSAEDISSVTLNDNNNSVGENDFGLKHNINGVDSQSKEQLLKYLYPSIRSTCHLLDQAGYKRHAHNLATFFLKSGGDTFVTDQSTFFRNIQFQNVVHDVIKTSTLPQTNYGTLNNRNTTLFDENDSLSFYHTIDTTKQLHPTSINGHNDKHNLHDPEPACDIILENTVLQTSMRNVLPGLLDAFDDVTLTLPASTPIPQHIGVAFQHYCEDINPKNSNNIKYDNGRLHQSVHLFDTTLLQSLPALALSDYIDRSAYKNDDLLTTPVRSRRKLINPHDKRTKSQQQKNFDPKKAEERRLEAKEKNLDRKQYDAQQFDRIARDETIKKHERIPSRKSGNNNSNHHNHANNSQSENLYENNNLNNSVVIEGLFFKSETKSNKGTSKIQNKQCSSSSYLNDDIPSVSHTTITNGHISKPFSRKNVPNYKPSNRTFSSILHSTKTEKH